jgi:pimeloyl-ACP methyl ester carboxylesterase
MSYASDEMAPNPECGSRRFVTVAGHRIEYERIRAASAHRPTLVFLHEGLGSIAMWQDFPGRVAHATNCDAVVYSRYGYGNSDPLAEWRAVGYMHDEALLALPSFLDQLGIVRPILIGHSDGGSIALIHAGAGAGVRPVTAVVTLAAHVMVEAVSIASIAAAKSAYETTDLRAKLARYHADVDSVFQGWNRIWLAPEFRAWNIEEYLPRIACPVLAIQGEDDEYGTMEQMRRIGMQVGAVELLELEDCGHSPHRDQRDAVLAAIARFVGRVAAK